MSDKYTLREVHVEVQPGIKVVADVSTVDGIAQLITDMKGKGLVETVKPKPHETQDRTEVKGGGAGAEDSSSGRIERNAELPAGSLVKSNVLAFKDDVPQLLRPSAFGGPTDGALVLVHALETGLKKSSIDYDDFKALYEAQNLKSSTPLTMLLTNLRNSGYLDKATYKDGRKVRLTAKGDKQAIQILRKLAVPE